MSEAGTPGSAGFAGGDGTTRYVSPAVEEVLGYRPDELEGADAFAFAHPEDAPRAWSAFSSNLDRPGPHEPAGFRARRKDGSWREVEVAPDNRLSDPEVRGVVLALRASAGGRGRRFRRGRKGGIRVAHPPPKPPPPSPAKPPPPSPNRASSTLVGVGR